MRKALAALSVTIAALVATTGCGGDRTEGATPPTTPAPMTPGETGNGTPAGRAEVKVGDTKLGKILVDAEGRTLYLFEKDKDRKSDCYDACAKAWPPYLTTGKPEAGEGAKADLLSTTTRDDGSKQVVYGKWPLYYYQNDKNPGDTTGHDIEGFGAEWYALTPAGKKASG
ncbi:COG4315 family predicted lipoprotein [Nonomuraea africana]|uniref:Lipoprotein with Yx(FWY)xxD motif n=1 Tax=Nonomuraea africana TaxID=46171 RepID=A0ABR9K654_9ACTN|nr:hypothetical protein [Nonomuraea africana]MBE1557365.1 putative lipoprotein with Yx(FWY)xxD motif [Nonomuraea africana]